MKIENVAIFGGNGTVGSLMAGIISGFGKANVYLISRDKTKINEKLLDKIFNSIKSDSIKERIIACSYEDTKKILSCCDWIFESVSESYEIKEKTYELIDKYAKPDAIITTGTSGLSINKLSTAFSEEKRKYFFGTHFFNPPYHMNLCELVVGQHTEQSIVQKFNEYLKTTLLRTTIFSKDKPAFIANRIGFKLMNDLLLLAEKKENGIEYIDTLFTGYTGRNMPPLTTIDFVGLDIHKAIVDNVFNQTDDEFRCSFKTSEWFNEKVKAGDLGDKVGKGLFKKEEMLVFDIDKNKYNIKKTTPIKEIEEIKDLIREGQYIEAYRNLFNDETIEDKKIVAKVLVEYIVYSIYVSKTVANNIEDCDDAMANGFGWCPPIALKELIDEVADFRSLCEKYVGKNIMEKYDLYKTIECLPRSKYDYRKYIKAI